jgi:hypothetical protein
MKLLVAGVLLLCACGGAAATRDTAEAPAVDNEEATAQARGVVDEVHGSIKRGAPEGMLPIIAEDVVAIGARGEAFTDRSAVIVALTDALGNQRSEKHKVSAKNVSIGISDGGRAAWATETVNVDGTAYVATAILSDVDDIWVVSAVHLAHPVPDKKRDTAIAPAAPPAGIEELARPAVDLLMEALDDPEPRAVLGEQLADGASTTWIETSGKITRGGNKIRKAWKKAAKKKPTIELAGDVHAGVSADGKVAWVLAGAVLGQKKQDPVPARLFYVYRNDGDAWRLVVAHEAVLTK